MGFGLRFGFGYLDNYVNYLTCWANLFCWYWMILFNSSFVFDGPRGSHSFCFDDWQHLVTFIDSDRKAPVGQSYRCENNGRVEIQQYFVTSMTVQMSRIWGGW